MNGSRWNTTMMALALGIAGACGSDGGGSSGEGSGGGISSGLPADKTLSTLTDADAMAACEAFNASAMQTFSMSELLRVECVTVGLRQAITVNADGSYAVDTTKCQMAADACIADPDSVGVSVSEETGDCSTASADEDLATCDATVAEYESCANKILAQAKQLLQSITCSNGDMLIMSDGDTALSPESIPECQAFMEKCPDVELAGGTVEANVLDPASFMMK